MLYNEAIISLLDTTCKQLNSQCQEWCASSGVVGKLHPMCPKHYCLFPMLLITPIAEDNTHIIQGTWRNQKRTDLIGQSLLAAFRMPEDAVHVLEGRNNSQSYPVMNTISHNNNYSLKTCPVGQWWHKHHGRNQLL